MWNDRGAPSGKLLCSFDAAAAISVEIHTRLDPRLFQHLVHNGDRFIIWELHVHLSGRDTASRPADLAVHPIEMILSTENSRQKNDFPVVPAGLLSTPLARQESDSRPSSKLPQLNSGVDERQRPRAHGGNRARPVTSGHLGRQPRQVRQRRFFLLLHHRPQLSFDQRAMANFFPRLPIRPTHNNIPLPGCIPGNLYCKSYTRSSASPSTVSKWSATLCALLGSPIVRTQASAYCFAQTRHFRARPHPARQCPRARPDVTKPAHVHAHAVPARAKPRASPFRSRVGRRHDLN